MALFERGEDQDDQDRYGQHEQDEVRAIKLVLSGLGGSLPASLLVEQGRHGDDRGHHDGGGRQQPA